MNVIYRQDWTKGHSLHIHKDDIQAFAMEFYTAHPEDKRQMKGSPKAIHLNAGQKHGITGLGKWVN